MKNVILAVFLLTVSTTVYAGNMELFDCEGKETGKIKGWVSKEQLLIECFEKPSICKEHSIEPICLCSIKFGIHQFKGMKDEDGVFISVYIPQTELEKKSLLPYSPSYFRFDPQTGEVQGVTVAPWNYFIGKCKKH